MRGAFQLRTNLKVHDPGCTHGREQELSEACASRPPDSNEDDWSCGVFYGISASWPHIAKGGNHRHHSVQPGHFADYLL